MASPKFCSPFGKLSLSLDEKKELCRTAKRIVRETIEDYERHLWTDNERLNPTRWSVEREREDVRVYHDRRPGAGTEDKDLHVLLTIGTVVGTLNDAMYGVLNHTIDAMRLKTAYVHDTLVNGAVLATIQEPKADKPFRSLTVKWLVKGLPLAARCLTRQRDVVYIEATGMRRLSSGEEVGFQLLHSVKFQQTPALPQYIRTGMSLCAIWRQQTPQRVQAYMKTYLEVPERLRAPLIVRASADAMVSLWRYMHCAQMKKLAWLMRRKTPLLEEKSCHGNGPEHPSSVREDGCAVCGSASSSAKQGAKSMCVICNRSVCTSCRVRRDLCSISNTNSQQLLQRRVAFCVPCLTIAVRADAAEVAADEIPGERLLRGALSELVRVVGTRASYPMVTTTTTIRTMNTSHSRQLSSTGSSHSSSTSSTHSGTGRNGDRDRDRDGNVDRDHDRERRSLSVSATSGMKTTTSPVQRQHPHQSRQLRQASSKWP